MIEIDKFNSLPDDDLGGAVDRLIGAESKSTQEEAIERALRPKRLAEYVGQAKIREQLAIFIEAARKRADTLDHVLLFGPPGLGKTTLAHIIADVPGLTILTVATFFFSMVPVVGATLIWLGAAAWLYDGDQTGWAIFMVLWGMFGISSVDNFVKPILISRTASLPLLLIVVGVFGGVLVFGFIGLFLGPTLLALSQVLIREWLAHPDFEEPSI